jgi:hypothetical protein
LIDKNALFFYTDESSKYKEKLLGMTELEFLNKKSGKIYKIFDR